MIRALVLVASILTASASANALSHRAVDLCPALESIAHKHSAWKEEFVRFQSDADTKISNAGKRHVQRQSLELVANRLRDLQSLTGRESSNRELLAETTRFLRDYDAGDLSNSSATYIMTSALPKYEEAIDAALFKAQVANQECDLTDAGSPQMNSRSVRSSQ